MKSGQQRQFEKAYGSNGEWVRLFKKSRAYGGTELLRDPVRKGRYVTLDFWTSRLACERFRKKWQRDYAEIDARCARLTAAERLLGMFVLMRRV